MGTTQRISPGVPGQPNWGDLNKSVTNVAKTVDRENDDNTNSGNKTPTQAANDYKKLIVRRNYHLNAMFRNLVKTGGGSKSISRGKSSSIGKAGLRTSGKLVGFISSVGSRGLQGALADIGFGNIDGKNIQDVIDFLLVYCADTTTGMDETAASKASCEVLNELAVQANSDLELFEQNLKDLLQEAALAELLCRFWGHYIFEHLSQRFQEKITQQRGEAISRETFKIIKDDILGRIKVLNESRPVSQINWKGAEGQRQIESIFESIIKILSDEDDN
jgi:hypothetical protein